MTRQTVLIAGCSTRKVSDGAALASLPGVKVFSLDVTKEASVTAAVHATIDALGSIDVLVNDAGYGTIGPFETASPDVIARRFDTNMHGVFTTPRAVLPAMRRQRAGSSST